MGITVTKLIVTRDELMFLLSLEDQFITNWISAGMDGIPMMPHMKGLGKSTRFHLATVEAWLVEYFQRGGEKDLRKPAPRAS